MVFIKVLKVSQEGSELAIVAVPEAQGSTSCHQLPAESHAGTDDTGGTVCDMSGSTRCSPRSFRSHSQLFFRSHLSFLSFRGWWNESNY